MKLLQGYFKNFKCIVEEELEFGKINVIVGDPGEGKTAILEAITFALTNELSDKISEYVRWGCDEFNIQLLFEHNNHTYDYSITGSKKSTSSRKLIVDKDEENAFVNSAAVSELASIFDPTLMLYSNISMQHESTILLTEKSAPRLAKFKQIFKVDQLVPCTSKINDDMDQIHDDMIEVEVSLSNNKSRTFDYMELPVLPDIEIEEKEDKLKQLYKDKEIYDEECLESVAHEQKRSQYEKAVYEINTLEEKVTLIDDSISEIHYKEQIDFDEDYFSEQEKLSLIYNSNSNIVKRNKEKISRFEEELVELSKPQRKLREPTYNEAGIEELRKKEVETNYELKEYDRIYQLMRQDKCPTCGQSFKSDMSVEELNSNRDELNDTLTELRETIQKAIISNKDYMNKTQLLEEKKKRRKDIENSLATLQEECSEMESSYKGFDSEQFSKLKNKHEEFTEIWKFNDEVENVATSKQVEKDMLEVQIKTYKKVKDPGKFVFSIKFDKDKFTDLKFEIDEYTRIEKDLERVDEFNFKIREEEHKVQQQILDGEKQLSDTRRNLSELKSVRDILGKSFASYLIEKGTKHVQRKMNEFFQNSYGKYKVEFKQNKRGLDYFYTENGTDLHSVNTLSGFEQCVFAISQRVALSSIQNLGVFVGDEIDSDAGSENSITLFENILNEDYNQYFFITHNNDTKDYLDSIGGTLFNVEQGRIV